MGPSPRAIPLVLAALSAGALPASAGDLERLVMPGPVARAHASTESDCGKCHQPFGRTDQDTLCLACHEEVGEDVGAHRGFHGRAPTVAGAPCRSCHPEHRGRDFDILGLAPETFDHDVTDFPLQGAHPRVACASCHDPEHAHREAPHACAACHRDEEPHRGRLGDACGDCHRAEDWHAVRFDHGPTGFVLAGRHRDVDCVLCHANERYEATPRDCSTCHRIDDVHRGTFGPRCGDCHDPAGWRQTGFDHDRDTRFALEGAHRRTGCQSCHHADPAREKLASDCYSCHRLDDEHRGARGVDCRRCHGAAAWKPARFDHDETRFPLTGAHATAECRACHRQPPFEEKLRTGCYACHAADDPHDGQEGTDCAHCHDDASWTARVRFDHELTRFPLLGMHAVTACGECHLGSAFLDAETGCVACHAPDDAHRKALGPDCALCHTPNGWKLWRFDHDLRTGFPLRGSHAGLDCEACHTPSARDAPHLRSDCVACHERDDAHRRAFGPDCARCHTERSWRGAEILP